MTLEDYARSLGWTSATTDEGWIYWYPPNWDGDRGSIARSGLQESSIYPEYYALYVAPELAALQAAWDAAQAQQRAAEAAAAAAAAAAAQVAAATAAQAAAEYAANNPPTLEQYVLSRGWRPETREEGWIYWYPPNYDGDSGRGSIYRFGLESDGEGYTTAMNFQYISDYTRDSRGRYPFGLSGQPVQYGMYTLDVEQRHPRHVIRNDFRFLRSGVPWSEIMDAAIRERATLPPEVPGRDADVGEIYDTHWGYMVPAELAEYVIAMTLAAYMRNNPKSGLDAFVDGPGVFFLVVSMFMIPLMVSIQAAGGLLATLSAPAGLDAATMAFAAEAAALEATAASAAIAQAELDAYIAGEVTIETAAPNVTGTIAETGGGMFDWADIGSELDFDIIDVADDVAGEVWEDVIGDVGGEVWEDIAGEVVDDVIDAGGDSIFDNVWQDYGIEDFGIEDWTFTPEQVGEIDVFGIDELGPQISDALQTGASTDWTQYANQIGKFIKDYGGTIYRLVTATSPTGTPIIRPQVVRTPDGRIVQIDPLTGRPRAVTQTGNMLPYSVSGNDLTATLQKFAVPLAIAGGAFLLLMLNNDKDRKRA